MAFAITIKEKNCISENRLVEFKLDYRNSA